MLEYTTVAFDACQKGEGKGEGKETDWQYVLLHPEIWYLRVLENLILTRKKQRAAGPPAMYDYDLFAVINHDGQLNNGHYTNFARHCDEVFVKMMPALIPVDIWFYMVEQWYRFDDDKYVSLSIGDSSHLSDWSVHPEQSLSIHYTGVSQLHSLYVFLCQATVGL